MSPLCVMMDLGPPETVRQMRHETFSFRWALIFGEVL